MPSPAPDASGPIRVAAPLRIEKATIPLALVAGSALLLGAYFYSALVAATRDVAAEVRVTRETISAINTRVTVLEAARLDERVRVLEGTAMRNGTRLDVIEREGAKQGGGR